MPKLAAKMRKEVEKTEAANGEFPVWSPGKYVGTLNAVEAKNSAAGNPMWVAEFGDITDMDGEKMPGRQWYNLNLPTTAEAPDGYANGQEKWTQYQNLCRGRIKAFFEAFGYTVDSDTDEMIGDQAILQIGVRTIQNGERAGQQTNSVNGVLPYDGTATSGDDGDDEF